MKRNVIDAISVGRDTLNYCRESLAIAIRLQEDRPPFTGESLAALSDAHSLAASGYLKRFEQLEDICTRMMRSILAYDRVDIAELGNLAMFDMIEKRRLIADAREWRKIRDQRNELVHEYPSKMADRANRFNVAWQLHDSLLETADSIARKLDDILDEAAND
jgi:hypothetical protein